MPTTRTEGDLPDSCFAYVPAGGNPSERKLRLCSLETGQLDAGIIGAAAAALGPGYRGQKVQLPSGAVGAAKAKVRAAWKRANPGKSPDDMPSGIRATEVSVRPLLFATPQEWIAYLPRPGSYAHPLYGEINLTPTKLARIVANFHANTYGQQLPINAEHDSKASGAVGYITDMRLADDGSIEVKPQWNERGQALLAGDRFRYVSAEFFDQWQEPVSGDWHQDVANGLAICTRPHFKTDVLRPLAASEAEALAMEQGTQPIRWVSEGGVEIESVQFNKETSMTEDEQKRQDEAAAAAAKAEEERKQQEADAAAEAAKATEAAKPVEAETVTQLTERIMAELTDKLGEKPSISDPVVKEFVERAAREVAELRTQAKTSETKAAQLAEQNALLQTQNRVKFFTDEVLGRSDSNGTAWVGEVAEHVKMACTLAEKFGSESWELQHYIQSNRAHAEQIKAGYLFKEIGTGRGTEGLSAHDKIEIAARTLKEADPSLTKEAAYTKALTDHPELYDQMTKE